MNGLASRYPAGTEYLISHRDLRRSVRAGVRFRPGADGHQKRGVAFPDYSSQGRVSVIFGRRARPSFYFDPKYPYVI